MLTFFAILIFGVIFFVAFISNSFSPHTVWGYLFTLSVPNILLRSIYIDFGIGLDILNPWNSFLSNLTIDRLEVGALYYLIITIIMAAGFIFLPQSRIISPWIFRSYEKVQVNYSRAIFILNIYIGCSIAALIYFIVIHFKLGDNTATDLMDYRGTSEDLDSYQANGLLRLIINIGFIGGLIAYYLLICRGSKLTSQVFNLKLIIVLSTLISISMSVFTQSRSGFGFSLLSFSLVHRVQTGRWWSLKYMSILILIIALVFNILTVNRKGVGIQNSGESFKFNQFLTLFTMNNGGLDISKTILIVDGYESSQKYLFGESFLGIIWTYIPRSIWKNKPTNLDTQIGFEFFGAEVYGSGAVPPGLPAELFMNFGYLGVIIGIFFVGCVAKALNNDYLANRQAFLYPVYYIACANNLFYGFMASGFTSALMGSLSNYFIIYIAARYLIVTGSQKRIERF